MECQGGNRPDSLASTSARSLVLSESGVKATLSGRLFCHEKTPSVACIGIEMQALSLAPIQKGTWLNFSLDGDETSVLHALEALLSAFEPFVIAGGQ